MTERNLIGWPAVFEYVMEDGTLSFIPPPMDREWIDSGRGVRPSSQIFTLKIFDLTAYEELARTNALYSSEHRGPKGEIIDGRPTS